MRRFRPSRILTHPKPMLADRHNLPRRHHAVTEGKNAGFGGPDPVTGYTLNMSPVSQCRSLTISNHFYNIVSYSTQKGKFLSPNSCLLFLLPQPWENLQCSSTGNVHLQLAVQYQTSQPAPATAATAANQP